MQGNKTNSKYHNQKSQSTNQQRKKSTNQVKTSSSVSKKRSNQNRYNQYTNLSTFDKVVYSIKNCKNPSAKKTASATNNSSNQKKEKLVYTQDLIGIRQIIGGMICLDSGQVIGIQEIIPINFYQRKALERNMITDSFKGFFKIAPDHIHFKVRTQKADISKNIAYIRRCTENETDPHFLREVEDYIKHMKKLQNNDSICKKFYVIYEYEGDENGKKSNDLNDIYRSMEMTRIHIRNVFADTGNLTITPDNNNFHLCNILYEFFNPKTFIEETLQSRVLRMKHDEDMYNKGLEEKKQKHVGECDYVAPKGIRINHAKGYVVMDGVYHTFLALKDTGHPPLVNTGWVDLICPGLGYDVDIISQKLSHNLTLSSLQQYNRINRVSVRDAKYDIEKQEEKQEVVNNITFITDKMKFQDEDLWDTMIIITIRANSYKEMQNRRSALAKSLQTKSLYTEDSFLTPIKYLRMTMPFMYIDNTIFFKNKRNYVTSSMASLYCFTAYELFDEKGFILGTNTRNNSIVAIDNFNTDMFTNANIMILGTSGSGKTFLEEMLARRMRITDIHCHFVLPMKGYEYYNGVKAMGGQIIRLFPGSKDCINFMQIRPEQDIDREKIDPSMAIEKASLLTKKITFIGTFIELNMRGESLTTLEMTKLDKVVTQLYKRYGITDDNESIYYNKEMGILKDMPIPGDLYEAVKREDGLERVVSVLLPYIEGTCQNFNAQTNVCLTNPFTIYDVDEDLIGDKLLPPIMFLALGCVYDVMRGNILQKDVVFLDETWKMLINKSAAEQIHKMTKLVRGYAGAVVIASQDIEDFLNKSNGLGATLLTNTKIKFLLKMEADEIKTIADHLDLNNEDVKVLKKITKGCGMIYSNGDKTTVNFKASKREESLFTTDINVKKRLAEEKAQRLKRRNSKIIHDKKRVIHDIKI